MNWSAKVDSLGEARTVAELWAELIQRYELVEAERRGDNAAANEPSALRRLRADAA